MVSFVEKGSGESGGWRLRQKIYCQVRLKGERAVVMNGVRAWFNCIDAACTRMYTRCGCHVRVSEVDGDLKPSYLR